MEKKTVKSSKTTKKREYLSFDVSKQRGKGHCDKNFVGITDFRGLSLFEGIVLPHYTKLEAERYIKNSPGIEKKYKQILSVANDKMLILEV